jgi:hypothetical protein
MHTKDFLAQELRKAGLDEMAAKAATGYYHDYLSPLPFPEMQLAADLAAAATAGNEAALALRNRHLNGEFDANLEESNEWANSPDGRAAFDELTRTPTDKPRGKR